MLYQVCLDLPAANQILFVFRIAASGKDVRLVRKACVFRHQNRANALVVR
jgi:hypothetical protein